MWKHLNKRISTPIAINIILILLILLGGLIWWQYLEIRKKETDGKNCASDDDCIVFGKDGDCNCGCFNKNYSDWQPGEGCFLAAPTSCKCTNGKCEGVFYETADWQTYNNEEYIACGCGCCTGVEPTVECLYHSEGDDIQKIIEEDKAQAQSPICPTVGCSQPIKYIYCD